jgi:hypothetical protein
MKALSIHLLTKFEVSMSLSFPGESNASTSVSDILILAAGINAHPEVPQAVAKIACLLDLLSSESILSPKVKLIPTSENLSLTVFCAATKPTENG